jgi:thiamine-phosphate pyrophosphorylase
MPTDPEHGHPCRLYLISPPRFELEAFAEQLRTAISGGDVGSFQLRMKDADDKSIKAAAAHLLPICREHDIAFIINDRPDIAMEVGADGAHLGQDDLSFWPIDKTRQIMGPDFVIGISCHDSSHMAMQAGEDGADYVAFGAFHPTKSKSAEKLAQYGTPKPDMLEWWYHYTVLPCVAIGGMTPENCGPMVAAGADFIAAITAVWEHKQGPAKAVAQFNAAIKEGIKQRKELEAA